MPLVYKSSVPAIKLAENTELRTLLGITSQGQPRELSVESIKEYFDGKINTTDPNLLDPNLTASQGMIRKYIEAHKLSGPTGTQGNRGFQGFRGYTGAQGNRGFQGNQGVTGVFNSSNISDASANAIYNAILDKLKEDFMMLDGTNSPAGGFQFSGPVYSPKGFYQSEE